MTGNPTKKFKEFVLDTSVAVKWFSRERGHKEAKDLLRKLETKEIFLITSDLLLCEVGNALFKGKGLNALEVNEALFLLRELPINFFNLDPGRIERTTALMEKYDITFYDAIYASLSQEFNAPLISANPLDHKKIKEIRVIDLC